MLSDVYSSGDDSTAGQLHLCQAARGTSIDKTWGTTQIFYIGICFYGQFKWTTLSQSASGKQTSNSNSSLPADSCDDTLL